MTKKPVFFVAFQEQDNLGVGYISSVLIQAGFSIKIIDFRSGKEEILTQMIQHQPLVVGFSIIFQYHIDDFKDLIHYLREHGINCHFSAGGHYPSLRHKDLLNIIPQLDSIVLFEGEYTFLELVQSIYAGKEWKHLKGIAYSENGVHNRFPVPVRRPLREYVLGKKYATLLAGRGCFYNCSFCSIREFYSRPPGPLKRMRCPETVVKEMELLYRQLNATVFMFQDDDFPVAGKRGKEWISRFCEELTKRGLSEKVLWKINCRPDEVEPDGFKLMKNSGLFLVYLGIESGTDDGLRLMNKKMKAETSMKAVTLLKELDIQYDFGFMLFDPSSTYQSITDNLDFLERLCGDGSSPITYCKMLPYAETQIERQLKKIGRLKGKSGFMDYEFYDLSLNHFYDFTKDCFRDWITDHEGLLNIARWARYYSLVYQKYFPKTQRFKDLRKTTNAVITESNLFFIHTLKALILIFNVPTIGNYDFKRLFMVKDDVTQKHSQYKIKLNELIRNLENLVVK
jgi:radical SAM superfamily enzyme YgiQ (UPF0313 family)